MSRSSRYKHNQTKNNIFDVLLYIIQVIIAVFGIIGRFFASIFSKIAGTFGKTKTIIFILILACIIAVVSVVSYQSYAAEQKRIEDERLEQERIENEKLMREQKEREQQEFLRTRTDQDKIKAVMGVKPLNLPSKNLLMNITMQYPELPAGCESIALTNVLNYYGFQLNKTHIIKNYLPYSNSDFVNCYYGSPYDYVNGGVIMAPGIRSVANSFLINNNPSFYAVDVTGKTFDDLYAYVERGNPVIVWTSLQMGGLGRVIASKDPYVFYQNSHTVVLKGFDKTSNRAYFADSIYGDVWYDIARCKDIYNKQKCQAVVIVNKEELDAWLLGKDMSFDNTLKIDISKQNDNSDQSDEENQEEPNN